MFNDHDLMPDDLVHRMKYAESTIKKMKECLAEIETLQKQGFKTMSSHIAYKKELECQIKYNEQPQSQKPVESKTYNDLLKWLENNKIYYERCCKYLNCESKYLLDDKVNLNDLKTDIINVIKKAHQYHNNNLLVGHVVGGCYEMGFRWGDDYDNKNCTWTVGDRRCSCGAYKGFGWNTEYVNWFTDISLDSTKPIGFHEALWRC